MNWHVALLVGKSRGEPKDKHTRVHLVELFRPGIIRRLFLVTLHSRAIKAKTKTCKRLLLEEIFVCNSGFARHVLQVCLARTSRVEISS